MSIDRSTPQEEVIIGSGTATAAAPSCGVPRAPEQSACLILRSERNEERIFHLRGHKWTIGRRQDRDVRIADPCVSSLHAEIFRRGMHYVIRDNGSTNGTLVNGAPIHERRLSPNDRIDLAGVATLVFATPGTALTTGDTDAGGGDLTEGLRTQRLIPSTPDEAERAARTRSIAHSQAEAAARLATDPPAGGETMDDRRISVLYQFAEALGTTRSEGAILERTLDITLSLIPADRAMIFLGERMRDGDAEPLPAARRVRGGGESASAPVSRTIVAEVLRDGRAIGTADALFDDRYSGAESVEGGRIRAVMAAPIATRNGILGVLYLDTTAPGYFFSRSELMLVWAVAFQAALALENARLVGELERRMAVIEELAHVRGRLFSFATNDLKGPLATLLGCLGGLLPRVEGEPSTAWLAPELTTATATAQRLVDLLDDLLLRERARRET